MLVAMRSTEGRHIPVAHVGGSNTLSRWQKRRSGEPVTLFFRCRPIVFETLAGERRREGGCPSPLARLFISMGDFQNRQVVVVSSEKLDCNRQVALSIPPRHDHRWGTEM